ncbi:MAG: hypothetical protein ACRD16_13720 [Thermoanaerobaculia bacterium]
MNSDLFSACVFCASWLLGGDHPAPPSFSAEIAAAYASMQRQNRTAGSTGDDRSDVTEKLTAVGLRDVRLAPAGFGAGTPESELRLMVSFPNSHDEADEGSGAPGRIVATGGGRYENYSLLARRRVTQSDSVEIGFEQRRHKITDLVDLGGSKFQISEERDLIAERIDYFAGARHRWNGLELAAAWDHATIQGKNNTASSVISARGHLDGALVELRARKGSWGAAISAEALSGSLPVAAEFQPDFASRTRSSPAWTEALSGTVSRAAGKWDVFVSAFLDRSRLPFVSLAVLGAETRATDSGNRLDSLAREWGYEVSLRREVAPGVWPRIFYRAVHGNETVGLLSQDGASGQLRVRRGGGFPGNEFVVGLAAQFQIGRSGDTK